MVMWNALRVREVRAQLEFDAFWASMDGEVVIHGEHEPFGLD